MTTMVQVPLAALQAVHGCGRCLRCGRRLTDPLSISRGLGPECRTKVDPRWRDAAEMRTMLAIWRLFRG
jgi:Family of unknown function (DUF6011)